MPQPPAGYASNWQPPRRRRRWARGVSVVLAVGAVLGVGAAAYSRGLDNDRAATNAAGSNALPVEPDATTPLAPAAPAPAAPSRAEAAAPATKEPAKVKIGALRVAYDDTGLPRTSLPITVTNNGPVTRSFDVTVVAKSAQGSSLTSDTGTAANLRPGQSAQLQVLELVNDTLVAQLQQATFEVAEIFAY